jgi:murein DD-endopeptidase MepM/ murein hydrolase activator NlpD
MISRQAGRRIYTISSGHKRTKPKKTAGSRTTARQKNEPLSQREQRILLQLVACGSIFVLLVAVKLLLPGRMAQLNEHLSGLMQQNMDVQAVFSAVGRAVSGEENIGGTLEDVYQAVFKPQEGEPVETAATVEGQLQIPQALDSLRSFRTGAGGIWIGEEASSGNAAKTDQLQQTAPTEAAGQPETSTLAYVLYSDQNLPEHVSMEQAILGFDYCTPVMGTLSSNFGYREHPVEGEERFHYGIDIAADTGTAVGCFADGTVTAVGESSSYGKYLIVAHEGGYSTLYAHCSKVTASSGTSVTEGQKIAEVGETGMATGPHLHFELHRESDYLNPIYYVALG